MEHQHTHKGCCTPHVAGPEQDERRILLHGMLFTIHGEGDEMYCTFHEEALNRSGECDFPPQPIIDRMNELKEKLA